MTKLKKTEDIIAQKNSLRISLKMVLNSTYGLGNPMHTMSDIIKDMDSLTEEIRELRESSD